MQYIRLRQDVRCRSWKGKSRRLFLSSTSATIPLLTATVKRSYDINSTISWALEITKSDMISAAFLLLILTKHAVYVA
jgi:hypothetical protein